MKKTKYRGESNLILYYKNQLMKLNVRLRQTSQEARGLTGQNGNWIFRKQWNRIKLESVK